MAEKIEKNTEQKEVKLNFHQRVSRVQSELKAPKNQFNKFGNYHYRSCEDVCNAVKPLLAKYGLVLRLWDQVELIGDRYYIHATAELSDTESERTIYNHAYAREEETKKGMDGSQITGASSSYARKYALNGLFLIDDVRDSDATNEAGKEQLVNEEVRDGKYRRFLDDFFYQFPERKIKFLNNYKIERTDDLDSVLTLKEIDSLVTKMKKELNHNDNA